MDDYNEDNELDEIFKDKLKDYDPKKSALTQEQWVKVLEDMWVDKVDPKIRKVDIYQGCKTYGLVSRDPDKGFNLCNDPECHSCQLWDKWMRAELDKCVNDKEYFVKNYIKNDLEKGN